MDGMKVNGKFTLKIIQLTHDKNAAERRYVWRF